MSLFGIIGTALSVVSTIGKVAGSLSQVLPGDNADPQRNSERNAVDFGPRSGDNTEPSLGQVVFWRDQNTGEICAINQSCTTPANVFFPGYEGAASGDMAASTVSLPCQTKTRMGLFFKSYSDFDLDNMIITPAALKQSGPNSTPSKSSAATTAGTGGTAGTVPEPNTSLQSSGSNIPGFASGTSSTFKLGPAIQITASDTTIRIVVLGGYALAGLILLNVRGAGATAAHLVNVINSGFTGAGVGQGDDKAPNPQSSMTVDMPAGVNLSYGIKSIDITVAVIEPTSSISAGQKVVSEALTDQDLKRLTSVARNRA